MSPTQYRFGHNRYSGARRPRLPLLKVDTLIFYQRTFRSFCCNNQLSGARGWNIGMRIDELENAVAGIVDNASGGRQDAAWAGVETLLGAQCNEEMVALALVRIVEGGRVPIEKALLVLDAVYSAHSQNARVVGLLGEALEQARDIDLLNASPPEHPLFLKVVSSLTEMLETPQETDMEVQLLRGLSTAARMMARQRDEVVERCCRRLIELNPNDSSRHYNFGLFLKTRGRFREGMIANQAGEDLLDKYPDAYEWNLGICATGAGQGALALKVWKRLSQKIELGRFELPDGRYPQCKVRLAQRPLAERTADSDEPGVEETIWIERLSPCHGIIRSVLYQDLGIDYGDVILFDGAPITYHTYGEEKVPVYPHLATLVRRGYNVFDFAATQEKAGQISDASADLERDAILYAHSENFVRLCANCWRNPDFDHRHDVAIDKHVVTGRIAAPSDMEVRELLRQIDQAMAKRESCHIYTPDLCEAAGLVDRANFERRRFEMITSS